MTGGAFDRIPVCLTYKTDCLFTERTRFGLNAVAKVVGQKRERALCTKCLV